MNTVSSYSQHESSWFFSSSLLLLVYFHCTPAMNWCNGRLCMKSWIGCKGRVSIWKRGKSTTCLGDSLTCWRELIKKLVQLNSSGAELAGQPPQPKMKGNKRRKSWGLHQLFTSTNIYLSIKILMALHVRVCARVGRKKGECSSYSKMHITAS